MKDRDRNRHATITVIKPDGGGDTTIHDPSRPPTIKEVQSWVGGWIEQIMPPWVSSGVQIYAHEEGRIHNMKINQRASEIVGMDLVGTVVILKGFDSPSGIAGD